MEIQKLFASDRIQELFSNSFRDPSEFENKIPTISGINFSKPLNTPSKIPNWEIKKQIHNLPAINPPHSGGVLTMHQFAPYMAPIEVPSQNLASMPPYYGYMPQQMSFGNYTNTNIFNNFNTPNYIQPEMGGIPKNYFSPQNIGSISNIGQIENNYNIPGSFNNELYSKIGEIDNVSKHYKNKQNQIKNDWKDTFPGKNMLSKRESFKEQNNVTSRFLNANKKHLLFSSKSVDLAERKVLANMSNKVRLFWKGFNKTYPFPFKQSRLETTKNPDCQLLLIEKLQYNFKKVNPNQSMKVNEINEQHY